MHGITKCSKCDKVISQCRCIDHKEVRYEVCASCADKNVDKRAELIEEIESFFPHYSCDDCWYSCPMSEDGCCDDNKKGCNCGALDKRKRMLVFILARDKKNAEPLVKLPILMQGIRAGSPLEITYQRSKIMIEAIDATLTNLGVESKENNEK